MRTDEGYDETGATGARITNLGLLVEISAQT